MLRSGRNSVAESQAWNLAAVVRFHPSRPFSIRESRILDRYFWPAYLAHMSAPPKPRYQHYVYGRGRKLLLDADGNLVEEDLTEAEKADMMRLFQREEEYDDDFEH